MAEAADLDLPTEEKVDSIQTVGKLTRLLREKFGMTEDETEDLEKEEARAELKKRIRDIRAAAATRRRPGQAAENLNEILNTHNAKGQHLAELCHSIAAYLPNLDRNNKDNLKTQFDRPAEDILADVQTLLQKEECPILVAGETSSGKSTFLNLLLGGEILPVAHLSSTSTICEVKYGETRQAVVHLRKSAIAKFFGQKTVTIPLDGTEERQAELKSYMHLEGASRDSLPPAEKIEIFWPLPLLKGGIVIVDSPGVGESEMMDNVVTEYIPKCFAFLYIIDSSNAGGVQADRLGQLLKRYAEKENAEDFDPESAMFICNKWDTVPAEEQDKLKSDTFRKLSQMWPGLKESQVFYMSTRKARLVRC
ncbi:bacterial dynamin-like protein [Branchiostoma floridae x Branchiostoma japonicum]